MGCFLFFELRSNSGALSLDEVSQYHAGIVWLVLGLSEMEEGLGCGFRSLGLAVPDEIRSVLSMGK